MDGRNILGLMDYPLALIILGISTRKNLAKEFGFTADQVEVKIRDHLKALL
ncbi:MAG: hypothetical protein Ct9H300mP29_2310 [Candidatus Neomarinimicrobiota bacterium]|nr:MAG: hypothetical protein Ct9H300mP29_2310 [Candidatus Neomarinimicrobiota bacterium]